jgi:hypothetical protein
VWCEDCFGCPARCVLQVRVRVRVRVKVRVRVRVRVRVKCVVRGLLRLPEALCAAGMLCYVMVPLLPPVNCVEDSWGWWLHPTSASGRRAV